MAKNTTAKTKGPEDPFQLKGSPMPMQKLGCTYLSSWLSVITLGCSFPPLLISCAERRAWGVAGGFCTETS